MKTWLYGGLALLVVIIGTFLIVKKVSPLGFGWWGKYNTSSGFALKGHDPVAYFASGQAVPGEEQFVQDWGGVSWKFSSAENRQLFADDPESYVPQFGAFCSFAVSKGFTADISPDAWHIANGKLYVFADQNVRDAWVENLGNGSLADSTRHWSKR